MHYDRLLTEIVHQERLEDALGMVRRHDAGRGAVARWAARSWQGCRQAAAHALVALATRVAPTGTMRQSSTTALAE